MNALKKTLIPMPHQVSASGGRVLISAGAQPMYRLAVAEHDHPVYRRAAQTLQETLRAQGGLMPAAGEYVIELDIDPGADFAGHAVAGAYRLSVTEAGASLTGYDAGGVYYAAVTLAQLMEAENDRLYLTGAEIVDWPDFPTRGLFIEDRYGSDFLTREDWFKAVDYFANMKYNTLTVGVYGCWCHQYDGMLSEYLYVPFKKYPQLKTPRHVKYYSVSERKWVYKHNVLPTMFEDDYLGDLIAYGKERNITVKPLFNSYGHNTLVPRLFPELSARDAEGNPTGFGICPSDERTYEIMNDLYDEIIDRYLKPNGIDAMQIGLDEVWEGIGMDAEDPYKFHTPFCQCEKCRARSRGELMVEYITRLCLHLKEKGIKHVYIYYDMLFREFDILNEELVKQWKDAGIYDMVVIDWWSYNNAGKVFAGRETNSLFRSIYKSFTGYYHWSTPLEHLNNIRVIARIAKEKGAEGMEAYSSMEYSHDRSYWYHAELCWNMDTEPDQADFFRRYAEMNFPIEGERAQEALQLMLELMDSTYFDPEKSLASLMNLDYYTYTYVQADKPYPRRFPEEPFARIHEKTEEYVAHFEGIQEKAFRALSFFEHACEQGLGKRDIAGVWRQIAMHFETVAGEYLGLIALEQEKDAMAACERLEALIDERESLMRLTEEVRVPGNQYMYLRNQSIYRQILLDIYDYARACVAMNREFTLNMEDLTGITGDMLRFLR